MRENSPASEDIVVKRVQRRLERYFADLEKPQNFDDYKSPEASGTKIVTLSTDSKFPKPLETEKKSPLPPPPVSIAVPKVTAQPPLPPAAPKPSLLSESPVTPASGGDAPDIFTPVKTVASSTQKPISATPTSLPPIFGKEGSGAKIAPLSEAPTAVASSAPEASAKKVSSFLPIFMFFLALVAVLGVLLGWYWFTGGASQSLAP